MTKQGWYILIRTVLLCIVIAFCLLSLPSCKTQTVVVERVQKEYVHDTIREQRVDSVWQDRVHTEYIQGDTVYIKDSTSRVQVKTDDKAKVVEHFIHDSIPYEVKVPVEVMVVPPFYKGCAWIVICAILALVIYVAIRITKAVNLRK